MVFTNVPFWGKADIVVSLAAMLGRLPSPGKDFTGNIADELALIKTSHDGYDAWVSKIEMAPTESIEHSLEDSSEACIAARSMIGFDEEKNSPCLIVSPITNCDCGRQKRDCPSDIF